MILQQSSIFTEVIKSIYRFDHSVLYNPLVFRGFLMDLYCGEGTVLDDFLHILSQLQDKLKDQLLTRKDLQGITLSVENDSERLSVQRELYTLIYINKDLSSLDSIESKLQQIYKIVPKKSQAKKDSAFASSILLFEADDTSMNYGEYIKLKWKCNNPYSLMLSNGKQDMNVTMVDSIIVSALFERYTLTLYNNKGEVLDEKSITLRYDEYAYCINCGTKREDHTDIYCTYCGVKLT